MGNGITSLHQLPPAVGGKLRRGTDHVPWQNPMMGSMYEALKRAIERSRRFPKCRLKPKHDDDCHLQGVCLRQSSAVSGSMLVLGKHSPTVLMAER